MSAETFPETFEDLLRLTRTGSADGELQVYPDVPTTPPPATGAPSWFGPVDAGTLTDEPLRRPLASQWHAATRGRTSPPPPAAVPVIAPPFTTPSRWPAPSEVDVADPLSQDRVVQDHLDPADHAPATPGEVEQFPADRPEPGDQNQARDQNLDGDGDGEEPDLDAYADLVAFPTDDRACDVRSAYAQSAYAQSAYAASADALALPLPASRPGEVLTGGVPPRSRAHRRVDLAADPRRRRALTIGVAGGLAATVALAAVVAGGLHAADRADQHPIGAAAQGGAGATASRVMPSGSGASTAPSGSGSASTRASGSTTTKPGTLTGGAAAGARTVSATVYWLTTTTHAGARLVREIRPAADRGDALTSAVNGLLTLRPLDPAYRSPWRPTDHLVVRSTRAGITVDLGASAFAPGVHGLQARVAIQTLVWTATSAADRHVPVTVLVDGRSGYLAWGTVRLGRPMVRDLGVRAVVAVETPLESASLPAGLVRLTGLGAPADRRFGYVVRRDGRSVASGTALGTTSPTPGWWFFDIGVTLPAGHYTATVSVTGSGSRAGRWSDDRSFDVG